MTQYSKIYIYALIKVCFKEHGMKDIPSHRKILYNPNLLNVDIKSSS